MNPLVPQNDLFGLPVVLPRQRPLLERFLVPPFSVLDARQGYWQKRKREWATLGIRGEEGGRDGTLLKAQQVASFDYYRVKEGLRETTDTRSTSVFDPVLCECVYRWFCPPAGRILDPFAGEATKGIVAAYLGYQYTGIELRQEQVDANEEQAAKIDVAPQWLRGDSAGLSEMLCLEEDYDLIFTSPPYYDLEIYSKAEKDGSAFETYEKFMGWYEDIFRQAAARLKPNRFLVVKVGEIRDDKGFCRNFVGGNIACFLRLGLRYYNEAVLVTVVGSLPVRVGKAFGSYRKLGKTHQNLLCFWKGDDCRAIKEELGELAVPEETQ